MGVGILILGTLFLMGLAYWLRRNSRHYEDKTLRDVLSEEMRLVLRNERTENRLKKDRFEAALRTATKARIQTNEHKDRQK